MTSLIVQLLALLTPWPLRRRLLNLCCGFEIAPTARIGASLLLARRVSLAPGAAIGSLNLVRGLEELRLGAEARLGNRNWISATRLGHPGHFADQPERRPALVIEEHAAVTHSHLLDCTDTITIGRFATVGGWSTQILTHSIDLQEARQRSAPVSIGRYGFVGTRCVILKGAALPDFSVLAAGSVLVSSPQTEFRVYGGAPARELSELDASSLYFSRTAGVVA